MNCVSKISSPLLAFVFTMLLFSLFITSCDKKTDETVSPSPEYGSVTDVEGNTYKTVKIGGKWWMAENLKVTKYRNGNTINELQNDSSKWRKDTLGAYCKAENTVLGVNYGLLYNWYAVNHTNMLAPEGWHIASDEEWKQLESAIGMSSAILSKTGWRGSDEADKLKIESDKNWVEYKDIWQTNTTGFAALAGSCRLFNGDWGYPGLRHTGYWWSATTFESTEVWYRHMDYKNSGIFRYHCSKNYGFSVRCVKN